MFSSQALSFFKDLGRRLRNASGDPLSYTYLVQWISVAIQRGNAMAITGSMNFDGGGSITYSFYGICVFIIIIIIIIIIMQAVQIYKYTNYYLKK